MQVSKMLLLSLVSLGLGTACHGEKGEKASLPEKSVLSSDGQAAPQKPTEKPADANAAQAPAPASSEQAAPAAATPAGNGAAAPAAQTGDAQTAAANKAAEAVQLSFPGAVSSQRRSTLSFRVPGFVKTINLRAGNTCKKGATLATLDPRDYQLQLDMAKSNLESARVAAKNAETEFKREEELKAQNASSESSYDRVKTTSDNAKVNVKIAELNLTKAEQALGDTRLVAPYDCVISKQLTNVSESIKAGDGAFEVYDVSDIEVSFNVPERLAGKLKIGEKVEVRIPATGFQGNLDIARIVQVVDDKTRTFQIVAKAPQGDARIVPGLYAEGIVH